jgi:chemotaxis protein MotB
MQKSLIPLLAGLVLFSASCVSQKKYDDLLAEKVRVEALQAECEEQLAVTSTTLDRTEQQRAAMESQNTDLSRQLAETQNQLGSREKAYDELKEYYNTAVEQSGQLKGSLANQQQQLDQTRQQNLLLASNLEERERRVKELERILEEKDKAVNALKQRVSDALLNFKENDLTVEVRNGKVYVSLAEQLLFKSGSTKVDPKGVNALQQLGGALKGNQEINVMVEGHTDNVPLSGKGGCLNNNWDLSVMRATSIVEILTKNGVAPKQITAAGRGEFVPVTSNDSAEGRAKNRRTEIILTPKLDELFQILEAN